MITLIRPILFSFLNSEQVKRLIVDLLTKLAESTDNEVDDAAVEFIKTDFSLLNNDYFFGKAYTVSARTTSANQDLSAGVQSPFMLLPNLLMGSFGNGLRLWW